MTRFTSLDQLAHCSPFVRAQLEKHKDVFSGSESVSTPSEPGFDRGDYLGESKPRRERPEQDAGKLLVAYVKALVLKGGLRPWDFFYHVPNGGGRSRIEAGILYGQGLHKGWPDYGLDLPRRQYHGLRIELKAPDGSKPEQEQLDILARLESVGYKVNVCWGFEEAKDALDRYLDIAR